MCAALYCLFKCCALYIVSITARLRLLLKLGYDFGTMTVDHRVKEVELCLACLQARWRFIGISAEALLNIFIEVYGGKLMSRLSSCVRN